MAVIKKVNDGSRVLGIIYIVLIVVLTVLAIGGSILVRQFEYVAGTRNDAKHDGFGLALLLFLIVPPLAGGAVLVALISLVLWHRTIGQILLKLAFLLIVPVICFCAFQYMSPLSPVFLEGFEQWVLQEADIDAIQTWFVNEGAKHAGQRYYVKDGFPEESLTTSIC